MESRGRKGPYLQHPRLSSPRPLEVKVQLSTLREKLLGDVVCLRSLIPGTQGAGLQTHRCAPQGGAAPPPTYDIQLLIASNEKLLGNGPLLPP